MLSERLDTAVALIASLQARIDDLTRPDNTPDNSSVRSSKGQKPNQAEKPLRGVPRPGNLRRKGGGG